MYKYLHSYSIISNRLYNKVDDRIGRNEEIKNNNKILTKINEGLWIKVGHVRNYRFLN
jgi:hypothetical protein